MKIQIKQFAKKKIEALVKRDMQEASGLCGLDVSAETSLCT